MESQNIEKQLQELNEWIKSDLDSRELKRALAVKMSLQGWAYKAIVEVLNVSKSFISKWKKRYQLSGIKGLRLSYKGAKSYLTEQEKQEVIDWLQQQEFWDISELECYLVDQYDVVFQSPTSYYKLLESARISWQKAQKKPSKKDPEIIQKRIQEIQKILKRLLPEIRAGDIAVYAIDEVHLLEGNLITHLWGNSKERLHIPLINERNRQTYYGALNLLNQELILGKYDKGDGDCTVDFMKKLIEANPSQKIIIFWDGAAYHKGKKMREFLKEVNTGLTENNWKITCYLLAPYAPEENPIEAVWLQLKNLLRRCYRFCKNFSIIKRLFEMLARHKLFNFPNLKNYDAFSCLI
ncbi:MAG: IS630 family transposase [Microcoleaceae cyanobacterium]